MNRIVVENVMLARKADLGRDNFVFDLTPFSKTKSVKPGQFVHIRIPKSNIFFRRAFSVYDVDPEKKRISIMFKIVGRGTSSLAQMRQGDELGLLGPLGEGFELPSKRETVILVAGGIGMPPIYLLAKRLLEKGYDNKRLLCFYGAASKADLVDAKRIRRLGLSLYLSTDDGSYGFNGVVTEAVKKTINIADGKYRIYACGPEGMLKAVDTLAREYQIPGQLSLEAPMPCGIGICLGCIRPLTAGGYTRVCREGPVYDIGEVLL